MQKNWFVTQKKANTYNRKRLKHLDLKKDNDDIRLRDSNTSANGTYKATTQPMRLSFKDVTKQDLFDSTFAVHSSNDMHDKPDVEIADINKNR